MFLFLFLLGAFFFVGLYRTYTTYTTYTKNTECTRGEKKKKCWLEQGSPLEQPTALSGGLRLARPRLRMPPLGFAPINATPAIQTYNSNTLAEIVKVRRGMS